MKIDGDTRRAFRDIALVVWRSITHNFWYKLASLVVAVILWSYVITSNPSITREKILDVDIRVTGQSALSSREFALLTDVAQELPQAKVRVSVPQQNYQAVTAANVSCELDLSTIRSTGKQVIKLRPTTVLGTIVSVTPDVIELNVDDLAERNVPVNVKRNNMQKDLYWYDISRTDPSRINVKGPASIVERVSTAQVEIDYTNLTESQNLTFAPKILDDAGTEITELISKSTSSVTVSLDIYPVKVLPVSVDMDHILTGALPNGYQIDDVDPQPDTIIVAAEQSLLDSLTSVQLKPVDVSKATQSFNVNTPVNKLADVKNYSSEVVNVRVDISEMYQERSYSSVPVRLVNLDESRFSAKWSNPAAHITVYDMYSVVNRLEKDDLQVTVDLGGINEPGTYQLPIRLRVDNYPELGYTPEPTVATVTISAIDNQEGK